MVVTRLRLHFATRFGSITSRARHTGCRSLGLPQRKRHCPANLEARRRETRTASPFAGNGGGRARRSGPDQGTDPAAGGANHLFGANSRPAGSADQSGPGGCAARRTVIAIDGAGTHLPDARTVDAGLPVSATAGPGRPAESAILPEQPQQPTVATRTE